MTSTVRTALIAITALTLAATSLSAPSFAKDGGKHSGFGDYVLVAHEQDDDSYDDSYDDSAYEAGYQDYDGDDCDDNCD
jgi:hypothetical protein